MKPKSSFTKKDFYRLFYEKNLILTRTALKNSVKNDTLIVHTTNNIMDIESAIDTLIKDIREWYEIYIPEFSRAVPVDINFVEEILKKSRDELLNEIGISKEESIGADLDKSDIEPIMRLAKSIKQLYELKSLQGTYLETLMQVTCPNLREIAGSYLGGRLIRHANSLKNLMEMPASKIQILGAEKALFRHMISGAKPPKYGIIFQHPLIQKTEKEKQGKIARALADKISIAVKVDYFNGRFIGQSLREELERKFIKGFIKL